MYTRNDWNTAGKINGNEASRYKKFGQTFNADAWYWAMWVILGTTDYLHDTQKPLLNTSYSIQEKKKFRFFFI